MSLRPLAAWQPRKGRAARRWRYAAPILVAVTLAVAGCTQSSRTGPGGQPTKSPNQISAGSGPPTGTQLAHLLTHARLPAGWAPETGGGDPENDTGSSLEQALGPQPGQDGCNILDSATNATYFTNWWAVSTASLKIADNQAASLNLSVTGLTIAAYQPAGNAAKTLSMAAHLAGTCASFTDTDGSRVTVSSAPVPGIGSQALYLKSVEQPEQGSGGGVITAQVLLAQVGRYVIAVDNNNSGGALISQPTAESMAARLSRLVRTV